MTLPSGGGGAEVLEALEAAWSRARTVLLVGPPGIGKRRILATFAATKGRSLTVQGLTGDRAVPFATKARALRRVLLERPELVPAGWERNELARLLPDLLDAPGWQEPIRDDLAELRLVEAASAVLARALEGRASLVSTDLHLWDDASFAATSRFLAEFASPRVRTLGSFTPGTRNGTRQRELLALAESGLAEIVTVRPSHVAWAGVGAHGAGERSASPHPSGAVVLADSGRLWSLSRAAPAPVDVGGARNLLESWVDGLPTDATGLLCLRALAEDRFTQELAEHVLGLLPAGVMAADRELERHGLVDVAEPVHELVAAAVLRRAPPGALRDLRGRLAEALEGSGAHPAVIATHYLGAWRPADAFPHLLRAGDAAAALYAVEDARRWYLKGLWAAPGDRARAEALLRLDDVAPIGDASSFAAAVARELAALCVALADDALTVTCQLRRARRLARARHLDPAREAGEAALALAAEGNDQAAADRARMTLADIAHRGRRHDEAREQLLAVAATAAPRHRLEALERLAWLEETVGELTGAHEGHLQALRVARELGILPAIARLLTRVGAVEERLGLYEDSIASFLEAAAVAARTGDRQVQGLALADAAISYVDAGRLDAANTTAARATEASEPLGLDRSSAMAHFAQGYAFRRLGRWREARVDLTEALRLRNAGGDARGALVARFNLAAMDLERAQADGLRADHGAALATIAELETMHVEEFVAWCRLELAFLTADPTVAHGYVEAVRARRPTGRMALAADTADLRAALLEGNAAAVDEGRRALQRHLSGPLWIETSLAHLMLASAAADAPERRRRRMRGLRRIVEEVGSLGNDAARSRLAYLEARIPGR